MGQEEVCHRANICLLLPVHDDSGAPRSACRAWRARACAAGAWAGGQRQRQRRRGPGHARHADPAALLPCCPAPCRPRPSVRQRRALPLCHAAGTTPASTRRRLRRRWRRRARRGTRQACVPCCCRARRAAPAARRRGAAAGRRRGGRCRRAAGAAAVKVTRSAALLRAGQCRLDTACSCFGIKHCNTAKWLRRPPVPIAQGRWVGVATQPQRRAGRGLGSGAGYRCGA